MKCRWCLWDTHPFTRIFLAGLSLLLLCISGVARSAASEDAEGFYCYPGADGQGWVCDKGTHNKPQRPDSKRRVSPPTQSDATAAGPASAATGPLRTSTATAVGSSGDELRWNQIPAADASAAVPPTSAVSVDAAPNSAPRQSATERGTPQSATQRGTPRTTDPSQISTDPQNWYTPTTPRQTAPEHQLAEDLAASLYVQEADPAGYCSGRYVLRDYPQALDTDNEDFPIVAEADTLSSEIDVTAQLIGNVSVEQGNRLIHAPAAELNQQTRVARFTDGVRVDQPGLIMQGGSAEVHLDSKQADLHDVQFVLVDANLRGRAETLAQSPDGDLALQQNGFTRCEPGNNGWRLDTRKLDIKNDEVFGTARHAVLKLKSVPVFYTPYLKFPVSDERVSGFLFPNISYSDEDGGDVSLPYYFNLAPNYDATFVPRYIGRRGTGAELELRHKASWQDTVLGGALLPDDDLYNGTLSLKDFKEFSDEQMMNGVDVGAFEPADRWLGALDHRGRIGRFRTFADVTTVSDADYFRDLGSDLGISSRVELERKGEIQYNHNGLFMRLWGQRFQRLDDISIEDYQRLPELEMLYAAPLGPLELSMGATWSDFDRDTEGLSGLAAVTGERTHLEPRVRLPLSWPFGFLTVSGGYRYTSYELEQDSQAGGVQLLDDNPDRSIGTASVDGGLIFERELNWFKQDLIQTLEPRLYYLWQEFDDQDNLPRFDASALTFGYQQLFRGNRFSGLDRIGDANQASFGVTTRFLAEDTGREYFRFSLGEIFYFQDREVTLNGVQTVADRQSTSAIAAEVSALLAGYWRLTGTTVWDPNDNEVDEGGAALQYRRDNRHIFNLGFRNRRDQDIEQTDISLYWPITRQLSLIGRWNYDLVSGRTIEGIGGIEYSDCCLRVRLIARRFLESPASSDFSEVKGDDGIFLQIVFKGLAGFGTKAESVLERGIRGYRAPNQQDYFSRNRDF